MFEWLSTPQGKQILLGIGGRLMQSGARGERWGEGLGGAALGALQDLNQIQQSAELSRLRKLQTDELLRKAELEQKSERLRGQARAMIDPSTNGYAGIPETIRNPNLPAGLNPGATPEQRGISLQGIAAQLGDANLMKMANGMGEPQGGPFSGNAMDAQASNIVYQLEQKKASGQPLSDAERFQYGLARRHLMQPKMTGSPETGFYQTQPQPLPTWGAQPALPAPQQQGMPTPQINGMNALPAPIAPQRLTQGSKAQTEYNKASRTLADLTKAVNSLYTDVNRNGPQAGVGPVNAAARQRQSSKYTNVLIQLKELYNLGVLQGPDMEIMSKAILDPTDLKTAIKGKDAVTEGLKTIYQEIKNRKETLDSEYGLSYSNFPEFAYKSIPIPATQAEFDALPAGAQFKKPGDDKVYIKR